MKQSLRDRDFPRDKEFRERFVTCRLYGGGDRLAKARLILERLELSFGHKETIDRGTLSIEHVMPQTPTDWWKQELGDDWEATHETWLHTVGNLTLTGYNPELSNSYYPAKRALLAKSHVELNAWFSDAATWDDQAIARRGEALAEIALQIWPDFTGRREGDDGGIAAEEEEQEDVQLLTAKVVERLGGEVERVGSGRFRIVRLRDGMTVNIKYSKSHGDYY